MRNAEGEYVDVDSATATVQLRAQLDAQVKQNENLESEVAALREVGTKVISPSDLQCRLEQDTENSTACPQEKLDAQSKENKTLLSVVAALGEWVDKAALPPDLLEQVEVQGRENSRLSAEVRVLSAAEEEARRLQEQLDVEIMRYKERVEQLEANLKERTEENERLAATLATTAITQEHAAEIADYKEKLKKLEADLKEKENQKLAVPMATTTAIAQECVAQIVASKHKFEQLEADLKEKTEENERLAAPAATKTASVQEYAAQVAGYKERVEQLEADLKRRAEDNEKQGAPMAVQESSAQISGCKETISQLEAELKEKAQENDTLTARMATPTAIAEECASQVVKERVEQLETDLREKVEENDRPTIPMVTTTATAKEHVAQIDGYRTRVEHLEADLKEKAEENEKLAAALAATEISQEPATELAGHNCRAGQSEADLNEKAEESERLIAPLPVAPNVREHAETIGKPATDLVIDIENLKQEHRIELQLLKKEYAAIKTKAKILTKENKELADAYEIERASNTELENSLEDLVNLLEAERAVHRQQLMELRTVRKKFSSMRKKRVPIDAAYKASLVLLEQLEEKYRQAAAASAAVTTSSSSSSDTLEVIRTMKLIESLVLILDNEVGFESSLTSDASPSTITPSLDEKYLANLTAMCKSLELKVHAIKLENNDLKEKVKQISQEEAQPPTPVKEVGMQTIPVTVSEKSDLEQNDLYQTNLVLKEKSKNLTRELVDSTKAFEETIKSYETVIAKVKHSLSEKKQENEALRDKVRELVDSYEGTITFQEATIAEAESALTEKEQENDALKEELRVFVDSARFVEEEMTSFESAIAEGENALSEKEQENEALKNSLEEAKNALACLDSGSSSDSCEVARNQANEMPVNLTDIHVKKGNPVKNNDKTTAELMDQHVQTPEMDESELNDYRKVIEILKKKLEEGDAAAKALEADKQALIAEADKLKEDFATVISQFEEELALSCEASEAALRETRDECHVNKMALEQKQSECHQLKAELDEWKRNQRESSELCLVHETTTHQLRGNIDQLEEEVEQLQSHLSAKESKLEGALLSIEETMQFSERLRLECTKLQEEKDTAKQELQSATEEMQDLCAACTQLKEEKRTAREELEAVTTEVQDLRHKLQEHETLKEQLAEMRESVSVTTDDRDNARNEMRKASDTINDLSKTNEVMHIELSKLRENYLQETVRLNEHVAKMSNVVMKTTNDRDKAQHELKEAAATISALSKSNEDAHSELLETQEKAQKRQVKMDELRDELAALTGEVTSLTIKNGDLQNEIEQSKKAAAVTTNQIVALREQLKITEEEREEAQVAVKAAKGVHREAALAANNFKEDLQNTVSKLNDMVACNKSNEKQMQDLREEIQTVQEAREKASLVFDACNENNEKQLSSLRENVRIAEEARDSTHMELQNANTKLTELQTYAKTLQADHAMAVVSLGKEMDDQKALIQSLQNQMKEIEADKEEKRAMYEKDISLQQEVSLACFVK